MSAKERLQDQKGAGGGNLRLKRNSKAYSELKRRSCVQ